MLKWFRRGSSSGSSAPSSPVNQESEAAAKRTSLASRLAGLAHSPSSEQTASKPSAESTVSSEERKPGSALRRTLSLERLKSRGRSKQTEVQHAELAAAFEEVGIGFNATAPATSPSAGSRLKARASSFMRKPKHHETDTAAVIDVASSGAVAESEEGSPNVGNRIKRRAQSFLRTPSSKERTGPEQNEPATDNATPSSGSPLKRTESMARRVFGRGKNQQQGNVEQPTVPATAEATALLAAADTVKSVGNGLPDSPASILTISPGTSPSGEAVKVSKSPMAVEEAEALRSLGESGDGFAEVEIEPASESPTPSPDKLALSESEDEESKPPASLSAPPVASDAGNKAASKTMPASKVAVTPSCVPDSPSKAWQEIPTWPANPVVRAKELKLPPCLLAKGTGLPVQVCAYSTQVIAHFDPAASTLSKSFTTKKSSQENETVCLSTKELESSNAVTRHEEVKLSLKATSGKAVSLRLSFDPCPDAAQRQESAVGRRNKTNIVDKVLAEDEHRAEQNGPDTSAPALLTPPALNSSDWPTIAEAINGVNPCVQEDDSASTDKRPQSGRPKNHNKGKKGGGGGGGKGKGKKPKGKH